MKYKILLFDLDDTLLDFRAIEAISLPVLFESFGFSLTPEWLDVYNKINKQLWIDYEKGLIALQDVLNSRFSKAMKKLGYQVNGAEWEARYGQLLLNGHIRIEGALEVCKQLHKRHRLFIITNGLTKTQIKRLKDAKLYKYFEDIFTSEQIGAAKPSAKFFDYIAQHIPDFDKTQTLIIGDSLGTDIKGGILAGIDTCWFNRFKLESGKISPTYTITKLTDLYSIL